MSDLAFVWHPWRLWVYQASEFRNSVADMAKYTANDTQSLGRRIILLAVGILRANHWTLVIFERDHHCFGTRWSSRYYDAVLPLWDFHYITVSWPSYLYDGNFRTWEGGLCIESWRWSLHLPMAYYQFGHGVFSSLLSPCNLLDGQIPVHEKCGNPDHQMSYSDLN